MKNCEKCEGRAIARGLCSKHYQRAVKAGEIKVGRKSFEERLMSKVNKLGSIPNYAPHLNACWEWTASLDGKGYGQFQIGTFKNPKMARAHRLVYEMHKGKIPEGLVLDHLCRVTKCVNPDHLEPITHKENLQRGYWGTKTHCAKGHPFDESNTFYKKGKRKCRECSREWARKNYADKKRKPLAIPPGS